jgi:Putative auto-transporter adhesin, head GIN domain
MGVLRAMLACLMAVLAAGCTSLDEPAITGSGKIVASPVPVSSFSRLEVGGTFHVTATIGGTNSVTLHVDENLLDLVDVHVSGDTLHIGTKSGVNLHGANLSAEATALELTGVEVSGAAQVKLTGDTDAASLDLSASGVGQLTGTIGAQRARLELSGASHATLSGAVDALAMGASGASDLQGQDLRVRELMVELSGASSASVTVSGSISAEVSGASTLHYFGSPTFTKKDVSVGSSIEAG